MFMEGRRRGEDRRVYLERCSTRDWYDHLELEVAPYFKGRRLKRPALKQSIRAAIAEAMRLLREETDGLQGVVGNQSFLKQKKPTRVCHDRAEHERQGYYRPSCHSKFQRFIINHLFSRSCIVLHILNRHEGSSAEMVYVRSPKAILQHPSKARDQASTGASRSHTSWLSRDEGQ